MAKLHRDEPEVFNDYLEKCAEIYLKAAVAYPPDDEYHASTSPSSLLLLVSVDRRCVFMFYM